MPTPRAAFGAWLATLVLLSPGCDGEFRFDRPDPDLGFGGNTPASGGGTGAQGGTTGTDVDAGGADGAASCDRCKDYGLVCDDDWHMCVECATSADCPDNQLCEPTLHRCTPCTYDAGCEPGYVCAYPLYTCLPSCAASVDPDRDCSRSTHHCDLTRSVCVECASDDDCRGNPKGEHCAAGARCAPCAHDGDCTAPTEYCDPVSYTCVACRDYRDCTPPLVCDPATHLCGANDE
jgi:hypothetical protein